MFHNFLFRHCAKEGRAATKCQERGGQRFQWSNGRGLDPGPTRGRRDVRLRQRERQRLRVRQRRLGRRVDRLTQVQAP